MTRGHTCMYLDAHALQEEPQIILFLVPPCKVSSYIHLYITYIYLLWFPLARSIGLCF
jgi:hypothetical protein